MAAASAASTAGEQAATNASLENRCYQGRGSLEPQRRAQYAATLASLGALKQRLEQGGPSRRAQTRPGCWNLMPDKHGIFMRALPNPGRHPD